MFIRKKKAEAERKEALDALRTYYMGILDAKETEIQEVLTANGDLKRKNKKFARVVKDAAAQNSDLQADNDRLYDALTAKEKALAAIVAKPVHDCAKCKVKVSGNYRSCASCAANPKLVDKFEVVE